MKETTHTYRKNLILRNAQCPHPFKLVKYDLVVVVQLTQADEILGPLRMFDCFCVSVCRGGNMSENYEAFYMF